MTEAVILRRPTGQEEAEWSTPTTFSFPTFSGLIEKWNLGGYVLEVKHTSHPHEVVIHDVERFDQRRPQTLKPDGGTDDIFQFEGDDGNTYRIYHKRYKR